MSLRGGREHHPGGRPGGQAVSLEHAEGLLGGGIGGKLGQEVGAGGGAVIGHERREPHDLGWGGDPQVQRALGDRREVRELERRLARHHGHLDDERAVRVLRAAPAVEPLDEFRARGAGRELDGNGGTAVVLVGGGADPGAI